MNDILGRPLVEGDVVVYAEGRRDITIGVIRSFGKKMVSVVDYGADSDRWARKIYPDHVLRITDLPELTIYLLKR
jgi:hypothetical protein